MSGADYSIQIKVRNGPLLRAMRANGFWTVADLARALGGRQNSDIGNYLNLKEVPLNSRGEWRPLVLKMAETLKRLPEDLFPPQHIEQALKTNVGEFDASFDDVASLLADRNTPETFMIEGDKRKAITNALDILSPRYRQVIEMRFGLGDYEPHLLEEAARALGTSKQRVYQMELKALGKIKRSEHRRKLAAAFDIQGEAAA